jgi:hypothetical protein
VKRVSLRQALRRVGLLGRRPVRIWSDQWGAYWRAEAAGYTSEIDQAGLYEPADAFAHTRELGPEKRIEFHVPEDLPILFSGDMVIATIKGRKTQSRRRFDRAPWRRVRPGDRLYVRETLTVGEGCIDYAADGEECSDLQTETACRLFDHYKYDDDRIGGRDIPAIHMPRWASRLTLDVIAAAVVRLQAISGADALAEGFDQNGPNRLGLAVHTFAAYWRGQYGSLASDGPAAWEADPQVVKITFVAQQQNVDAQVPS